MLSTKLWHLIGLLNAVGKLFLKGRLNEGLQFIVNLFASKLHRVSLGETCKRLPWGCRFAAVAGGLLGARHGRRPPNGSWEHNSHHTPSETVCRDDNSPRERWNKLNGVL